MCIYNTDCIVSASPLFYQSREHIHIDCNQDTGQVQYEIDLYGNNSEQIFK